MFDPQPEAGSEVYCRRCAKYTEVAVSTVEWSWHCPADHSTRKFGADEAGARKSGRTHQRKHHHVVLLRKGYEVVEVLGPEGQGELSFGGERIEWVRAHQGPLKALVHKTMVQNGKAPAA